MKIEYKSLDFEIKAEKNGMFEGVAVAFNNVDLGNDRALKTIANGNINKKVPYLWQHNTQEPIGEIELISDSKGINFKGKLFLDTLENGMPAIPNAHKAYTLMKNGILKNSIGYIPLKYDFVTEGKKVVRNLKEIDIKEVSAVTFPMNPLAAITDVKEEGINKVEEKAMDFTEILNLRKANENRWQLSDALDISIRQLLQDSEMKIEEKIAQLNKNIDEFAAAYKETMTTILTFKSNNKKSVLDILETKSNDNNKINEEENLEKLTKDELKKIKDKINKLLEEETGEVEKEPEKEPEKTENKKDVIMDIEVKSEDLESLQETLKNLKLEG